MFRFTKGIFLFHGKRGLSVGIGNVGRSVSRRFVLYYIRIESAASEADLVDDPSSVGADWE